jgi:Ca2+-transporting ATPase
MTEVALSDILVLAPGAYIAADARLLDSHRLTIDESLLTGESLPSSKNGEYLGEEDTALGDRQNMVYMGTTVTGGNGRAIAVGTGRNTEIGKIQDLVQVLAVALPPLRSLLRLSPVGAFDIIAILAGAGLPFIANEAIKGINKNTFNQDNVK